MPTFLCHGFRWHRASIRIYTIVQDLDDVAPDWIVAPASAAALLASFHEAFDFLPEPHEPPLPEGDGNDAPPPTPRNKDWSPVKLLEQYDPNWLGSATMPYAFVADYVKPVGLSVSIAEEIQSYEEQQAALPSEERAMSGSHSDDFGGKNRKGKKVGWLEKLREQLQGQEEIRWFVVVCGDEERAVPDMPDVQEVPEAPEVPEETTTRRERPREISLPGVRGKSKSRSKSRGKREPPEPSHEDWPLPSPQPSPQSGGMPGDPPKSKGGGFRRLFGKKRATSPER